MIQLHEYQEHAVRFIHGHPRSMLNLDLGLGKTVITLTALHTQIQLGMIRRALVIAPLRVCNNVWRQEVDKWGIPLTIAIATGAEGQRIAALREAADVTVINRENVPWLIENIPWQRWDCVVIDESSSFKNPKAKRFKTLRTMLDKFERMILLTGTPAPNGLQDLWSQFYLLDKGERLGRTLGQFRSRYCICGYQVWDWKVRPDMHEHIHAVISDISLRMDSRDYLELPERIDLHETVELPKEVKEQYRELEKEFVLILEKDTVDAVSAGVLANKLLQLCNGFLYTDNEGTVLMHTAKIDTLSELLDEHPEENFLIAYNYKADLSMLLQNFPEARVLDDSNIEEWNAGRIRILLAHPASAGHGLNLQFGGRTIVWYSMTWNLELYEQFIGRLHRQGQAKPVRNIHLVVKDCLDERVCRALAGKAKTQNDLFEYLKNNR